MQLAHYLDFDSIRLGMSAKTKRALIGQLSTIAAQRLGLAAETVQACLGDRERLGSTGFGHGVAIPHGKIDGLTGVFSTVVQLADPVDYKAVDGAPVDLVFLLLSPPDAGAEHLKALAAVSRIARNPALLDKLRGARDREAFAAVLLGADERDAA